MKWQHSVNPFYYTMTFRASAKGVAYLGDFETVLTQPDAVDIGDRFAQTPRNHHN